MLLKRQFTICIITFIMSGPPPTTDWLANVSRVECLKILNEKMISGNESSLKWEVLRYVMSQKRIQVPLMRLAEYSIHVTSLLLLGRISKKKKKEKKRRKREDERKNEREKETKCN